VNREWRHGGSKRRGAARLGVFIAIVLATSPIGLAQWVHYPTAGIPRKADGTPDLTAPAPKLPDGKPDLSGIWRGNPRRCLSKDGQSVPCGVEIGGSPLGQNLGRDLPGGLPYHPWAAELTQQRRADFSRDDPHVRCMPDNPPRTWTLPHLTKILHTPKLLVTLYEVNAQYRQIFIDGRPFPDDPTPGWNGYSVGHWDGATLVIETRGFRDGLWIDNGGSPMSDAAKMTERLHRINLGTMELEITIDDPKVYTKPFTVKQTEYLEPDTELIDEFCIENEKSYERMLRSRNP
jgi:hypothetical protein